jgi:methionyl-tRNA formyltransferase
VDLIVLGGGWPELIPGRVIRLPRLGIINTHPSLLPEFRGTDVHRWQIYKGGSASGATIHYIDEQFDTGDIIDQVAIEVTDEDIPQSLFEKAARASVPLMACVLERIAEVAPHRIQGIKQKELDDKSKYYRKWRWNNKNFLRLDWARSAEENWRFIRACCQESYKYNGPFFNVRGREYIVREAGLAQHLGGIVGEICVINEQGVGIRCGSTDTILMIKQIQRGGLNLAWRRGHTGAWLAKQEGLKVGDNLVSLQRGSQK